MEKGELEDILKEIKPDVDFKNEKHLITDEILTSFDIVSLVAEIQDKFDVNLDITDLTPENFETIDSIYELIKEKEE